MSTAIAGALPGLLPGFLPGQRWFGDKARQIVACEVEDFAVLPGTTGAILVVALVGFADGARQRYSLVVATRPDAGGLPVLGTAPAGGWLVEAAADPDTARGFVRGWAADGELPMAEGGRLRYGDASADARRELSTTIPPVSALGAEQSNTSLRVGRRFVCKLFRRLDLGENPEVEVGRFLTAETTFRAMPTLEGSLTYVSPGGARATIGVLQQWVESSGDGWRHTLAGLRETVGSGRARPPLADDIAQLGTITADFHAALASSTTAPAFAPEPLTQDEVDMWLGELRAQTADAVAVVERRRSGWPEATRQLASEAIHRLPSASERLRAPDVGGAGAFSKIRIHGDFHLGQTLKTPTGFAIIDFEGEPAIPIARRRQKHGALKDVAGMLRSFEYAIETTCAENAGTADDLRAAAGLRRAFLDGYFVAATRHGARWVPASAEARARWLAIFEFGKALYELEYEINNRPGWVHIPLRGLLRTLDGPDR